MTNHASEPERQDGNEPAGRPFEVLAAEFRPMLLCYLSGVLGDRGLAEDLVQECFVTAGQKLDGFEPGGNFGAWLRGIARNKVREHRRAAARRPLIIDSRIVEGMEQVYSLFDSSSGGSERSGQWHDRLDLVRMCLARLKSKLRASVDAVYLKGDSLAAAATSLECSAAAVGQRLSRARRQIRECVEKNSTHDTP